MLTSCYLRVYDYFIIYEFMIILLFTSLLLFIIVTDLSTSCMESTLLPDVQEV
jgi:competence protein ComGC